MKKQIEKEIRNWYVCEKYNCIWYGKVAEMLPDYHYPENATFFFNTEEECINWINAKNLND